MQEVVEKRRALDILCKKHHNEWRVNAENLIEEQKNVEQEIAKYQEEGERIQQQLREIMVDQEHSDKRKNSENSTTNIEKKQKK